MKINSIIACIMVILSIASVLVPIKQEAAVFSNTANKCSVIGPLSPNRAVSFELDTGESSINKIILPLKRTGKNKKDGKIIYNVYAGDELRESGFIKYKDIESQMIDNELQLAIDLENDDIRGYIRVELYGEGLKSRINIPASDTRFDNFYTYLGKRKLNNNIMCSIMGEKSGHPYTWEVIMLTVISIMCIFVKGEENEKENSC